MFHDTNQRSQHLASYRHPGTIRQRSSIANNVNEFYSTKRYLSIPVPLDVFPTRSTINTENKEVSKAPWSFHRTRLCIVVPSTSSRAVSRDSLFKNSAPAIGGESCPIRTEREQPLTLVLVVEPAPLQIAGHWTERDHDEWSRNTRNIRYQRRRFAKRGTTPF